MLRMDALSAGRSEFVLDAVARTGMALKCRCYLTSEPTLQPPRVARQVSGRWVRRIVEAGRTEKLRGQWSPMITTRFVGLPSLRFHRRDQDGRFHGVDIPPALVEIDHGIAVLNEIEQAQVADLAKNAADLSGDPPYLNVDQRFISRELWRIGSYVMFATTLSGVIEGSYRDTKRLLERCDRRAFRRIGQRHAVRRKARRDELAETRSVRDRVFAHTAYAEEDKRDTPDVRSASLIYFSAKSIALGPTGMGIVVPGKAWRDLPMVTVERLSLTMTVHATEWFSLLGEATDALASVPDDTLLRHVEEAEVVRRARGLRPSSR